MPLTRRTFLTSTLAAAAGAQAALAALEQPPAAAPKNEEKTKPDQKPIVPKAEKPLKVLVLGGTVFLGPHTVERLLARGHTVTLFNRGKTRPELVPDVEKLRGDRDGGLAVLAGRRWDAVIDTSGYVPRIVRASAELLAPNVRQYVFVSSISVYTETTSPGVDESHKVATMPDPTSEVVMEFYGALKALCEQAAEAALPGRTTVIRPGLIVGPGDPTDRFSYWPVRVAQGGEVLAPGEPSDPVQVIDVRDLADFILTTLERGHVGVHNVNGPAEPLGIGALLDACKRVSGSDARFTWADNAFLEAQQIAAWSDMPVWVPPIGDGVGLTTTVSARAIARGLTYRPLDDTIKATLDWWATLPPERQSKLRAGITREREAAVLAAWHAQHAPAKPGKARPKARPRTAAQPAAAG
ncbi:MAG: NAD-dependent epimerase/dehydratase family protein [Myxococcales bacterium]|nr:NAD-dependent epimerase/dehydratase family protein [Myxococcales bacterium]